MFICHLVRICEAPLVAFDQLDLLSWALLQHLVHSPALEVGVAVACIWPEGVQWQLMGKELDGQRFEFGLRKQDTF